MHSISVMMLFEFVDLMQETIGNKFADDDEIEDNFGSGDVRDGGASERN